MGDGFLVPPPDVFAAGFAGVFADVLDAVVVLGPVVFAADADFADVFAAVAVLVALVFAVAGFFAAAVAPDAVLLFVAVAPDFVAAGFFAAVVVFFAVAGFATVAAVSCADASVFSGACSVTAGCVSAEFFSADWGADTALSSDTALRSARSLSSACRALSACSFWVWAIFSGLYR